MKTKGKRLDSIVFINADPRYAGKLDDPEGGDTTMLFLPLALPRGVARQEPAAKGESAC